MTPEELLEMNPNLASVAEYMQSHPGTPVRFWENGTVDITLPASSQLVPFIEKFVCPSCNNPTAGPELESGSLDIKGTFRTCSTCGIQFFIHNSVKFGGTH